MSLAEKFEEYAASVLFMNEVEEKSAQLAFYAGAEAGLSERTTDEGWEIQAEIDRFKGQK